jgi:hypothetical protein
MRTWAAGMSIATVLISTVVMGHARQEAQDDRLIRRVVEDAYVSGVFVTRDPAAVRRGFHRDFVLSVRQGDDIIVAPLDVWLARLELDSVRSSDRVEHMFDRVDITGRTAVVKLRITINGKHVYTDYMGLYRFPDGWKIVNKVFEDHD